MEQEDYVSFETAKMLEEKGYLRSCNATYFRSGVFVFGSEYQVSEIKAPTLYDAQKWLRDRYMVIVDIDTTYYDGFIFTCQAWSIDKVSDKHSFDTYEQALDKGIFEALKLI